MLKRDKNRRYNRRYYQSNSTPTKRGLYQIKLSTSRLELIGINWYKIESNWKEKNRIDIWNGLNWIGLNWIELYIRNEYVIFIGYNDSNDTKWNGILSWYDHIWNQVTQQNQKLNIACDGSVLIYICVL